MEWFFFTRKKPFQLPRLNRPLWAAWWEFLPSHVEMQWWTWVCFKKCWRFQPSKDIPSIKSVTWTQIISGTRNWKMEKFWGSVRPTNGLDQTKTGQKFRIYLFWSVWILESVKHWKLHETTTTHYFQRSLKFGQNPSNPNTTRTRKNKKMKPSTDSNHFNDHSMTKLFTYLRP